MNRLGVPPAAFWAMTPHETVAILDLETEIHDETDPEGLAPSDAEDLAEQFEMMKARYPDLPAAAKPAPQQD